MEIWRTEVFWRDLDRWATNAGTTLSNVFPECHYFSTNCIRSYSLLFNRQLHETLQPRARQQAGRVADAITSLFAAGHEKIANELLGGVEKNMQLLHTIAILQESQYSAEQGASMRRLTWITFIFLPMVRHLSYFPTALDVRND
jgi:hypothetical protein